jgi:thiol-disulfide isomerase/thioredoxin
MSPSAVCRAFTNSGPLLLCLLSLLAASCKQQDGDSRDTSGQREPDAIKTSGDSAPADAGSASSGAQQSGQWYRAWFIGGEEVGQIPFFLHLPARPHRGMAIIANGSHRLDAEVRWYGTEASVNLPLFRTRLFLRQSDSGELDGHLMSKSPLAGSAASLPLHAVPVPEPDESMRFAEPASCGASAEASAPAPPLPLGKWYASVDGMGEVEIVLEQKAPRVLTGTFSFGDGSVSSVIGNVFGSRICLSTFDGVNAALVVIDIPPNGKELRGSLVIGPGFEKRSTFTAEQREQVQVVANSIDFVPNKTKLSLFELGLPQYRGKPVIIEFAASWCPPCIDAVPLVSDLYKRHHGEGLEVVTLLFELLDDEETLRKQARLFVDTYDIPWQVIPVRGEIKPYWDIVPHDAAASVVNLPVTIFVNANGTIRDAHMGFPGPESGQLYQAIVERYQRAARELVAND